MAVYTEKYRPAKLSEIAGQPAIDALAAIVANPSPCCLLLHGPTGTGKSTAAECLARDLGCYKDQFETAYHVCAADFDAESIRRWLGPESPFRFAAPCGWHVLIIEEFEAVSKTAAILLKDCLERKLATFGNVIIVATSNDISAIPEPVRDRFKQYHFAGAATLAAGMGRYIQAIWRHENPGRPLPADWKSWGWNPETLEYSARRAIDALEEATRAASRQPHTV